MKNIIRYIIITFLLILITGCGEFDSIINNIEISDTKCNMINEKDTHRGFLGDGEYFAKLECSDIKEENLSKNWHKIPLSNNIKEAMDMKWCDDKSCKNFYDRYSVPVIKNGYYYFLDRHSEAKNKYKDDELNKRSSWNFTIALYDIDNKTIYYYERDT